MITLMAWLILLTHLGIVMTVLIVALRKLNCIQKLLTLFDIKAALLGSLVMVAIVLRLTLGTAVMPLLVRVFAKRCILFL
ncbi:MAG: hypothetical protein ACJA0M_001255 [Chitinophagales bacterium]|jgi:hypothetical protein